MKSSRGRTPAPAASARASLARAPTSDASGSSDGMELDTRAGKQPACHTAKMPHFARPRTPRTGQVSATGVRFQPQYFGNRSEPRGVREPERDAECATKPSAAPFRGSRDHSFRERSIRSGHGSLGARRRIAPTPLRVLWPTRRIRASERGQDLPAAAKGCRAPCSARAVPKSGKSSAATSCVPRSPRPPGSKPPSASRCSGARN